MQNNSLKNETMTLLKFNRELLNSIITAFEKTENQLRYNRVLVDSSNSANLLFWAESARQHFEKLRESTISDAELDRDLRRIIETFHLL